VKGEKHMYLYEVMSQVLKAHGNTPMRIEDIAAIINKRRPNLTKARFPVSTHQIGMRAVTDVQKGTPPLFEVLIKLR
jgi:hypothetical protein